MAQLLAVMKVVTESRSLEALKALRWWSQLSLEHPNKPATTESLQCSEGTSRHLLKCTTCGAWAFHWTPSMSCMEKRGSEVF